MERMSFPTLLSVSSVNQIFPSEPLTMGPTPYVVGVEYVVTMPSVVTLMSFRAEPLSQRLPSGPAVMPAEGEIGAQYCARTVPVGQSSRPSFPQSRDCHRGRP